jgi:ribonuclease J
MTPGEELLFLALGGSGEIGMNVNLYGCRGKWLLVDCGLTFADPNILASTSSCPTSSSSSSGPRTCSGSFITHGHEDTSARCPIWPPI